MVACEYDANVAAEGLGLRQACELTECPVDPDHGHRDVEDHDRVVGCIHSLPDKAQCRRQHLVLSHLVGQRNGGQLQVPGSFDQGLAQVRAHLVHGPTGAGQHDLVMHPGEQFLGLERLAHEVHRTDPQAGYPALGVLQGRQEDHGHVAGLRGSLQPAADLVAVQAWHAHIQQHQLRRGCQG